MTTSMRENDPMRRSGAEWCEVHDRWECTKKSKRTQSRCHGSAITGTATCRMHPGKTVERARAEGEVRMLAYAFDVLGDDVPVLAAADIAQRLLHMSWCRVHLLAERLRLQLEDEHGEGIVGATFAAGRDGARVETGEQVRALMRAEGEERDRCARLAKQCHDMGVDERYVQLAQAQAESVVGAFLAAVDVLDLVPGDRSRVVGVFLERLGAGELEAGAVAV